MADKFPWMILLVIGVVAYALNIGGIQQMFGGQAAAPPIVVNPPSGGGASGDCSYLPTVNALAGFDAVKTSTVATPTTGYYFLNGAYFGTSAPPVRKGDTWRVIGDLASYLSEEETVTIGCGANALIHHPYAYANATVVLKDDPVSSGNTLTQGGGAYNATLIASGGQRNIGLILQGTAQKSSSDLLLVFEGPASSSSKLSTVSLSCGGAVMPSVAIPAGVAATGAASFRTAWTIPAIIGASTQTCTIQMQTVAGQTQSGIVYMKWYAMQKSVLADGTVAVAAYDSTPNGANAAVYQDLYTSNFYINP
jgi:hypothetical protein